MPYIQLAFNAKVSTVTGCTPFSLMFGRALNDLKNSGRSTKPGDLDFVLWKKRQEDLHSTVYPAVEERVLKQKSNAAARFAAKK